MSIATELIKLKARRDSIVSAINDKGGTCEDEATLAECATAISNIPTGGGSQWTGHVDEVGLKAIGWTDDDIVYLQNHVWWNEEDDDFWKVSTENISLYTNATKTTVSGVEMAELSNLNTFKASHFCAFFPKIDTSTASSINLGSLLWTYAIPSIDLGNCTTISFSGDSSLVSIDASNWNTSKVTNISFTNCWAIKNIEVDNWDTREFKTVSFNNCRCLTYLNTSKWIMDKCNNLSSMFNGCDSLIYVDVSNWNMSNVTSISSMFAACSSLVSIDVSNWNTSKVTNISSMVQNCYSLKRFVMGENFKFDAVTSQNNINNFIYSAYNFTTYDNIKSLLTQINASTMLFSSPILTFSSGSSVSDDADGTLQTLMDACTAKGWTISNLTINAYGS